MYYSVQVKRDLFAADHGNTLSYFQGREKDYLTKEQADEYFQSFTDWEQDLLEIESFPF